MCLTHLAEKSSIEIFNFVVTNELVKCQYIFDYRITSRDKQFLKYFFVYNSQSLTMLKFSERQFHFGGKLGQEILNTLIDNIYAN